MSTQNISRKIRFKTAKRFKESFVENNQFNVGYVTLGKSLPYENENEPDNLVDTVKQEKEFWDNMFAAKKVVPGDVELVIKRYQWQSGNRYKQYDDTKTLEFLLSETIDDEDIVYPMYVINSEGNVYKCLCNNVSSISDIEPTGDYSENDGFISTTDEGGDSCYLWKYMYSIRPSNKFLTNEWMPVPGTINSLTAVEYNMDESNFVDGGLNKIIVTNRGSGYVHSTLVLNSFEEGQTVLTVPTTENIAVNMLITGTGISVGTFITAVSVELNRITISSPTTSAGGGISNPVSFKTRVVIEGDGTGTTTDVRLIGDQIEKIDVTTTGVGYNFANIIIYGSGTDAEARAVLPPKFGHGYNPANELGATSVMISQRIGEVDSTEGGLITVDNSFRQYGLLINPHKYNESEPVTSSNADSVVSQTLDVTLLAGDSYPLNAFVYQGPEEKPTFSGYINNQDAQTIRLTNTLGDVTIGTLMYSTDSSVTRPVASVSFPKLEPYTGDMIYTKNTTAVERTQGQSEEIKFVIQF
jgi:hypothetical protein